MAKNHSHTYRSAAQAHAKVTAARRELLAAAASSTEEEPMHRYTHPIPLTVQTQIPEAAAPVSPQAVGDAPAAMTQILEQLACQSQLLVDLLGAVNSLTAALLVRNDKS